MSSNRFARDVSIKVGVLVGAASAQAVTLPGVAWDATAEAYARTREASESAEIVAEDQRVFEAALEPRGKTARTGSRFGPRSVK